MAQPHYVTETQILRNVANDPRCRWRFTIHSLEEVAADGRSADDIKHVIMTNGQVILQEQKKDILWRVEGRDLDGEKIRVVVAVYEMAVMIKVITTF